MQRVSPDVPQAPSSPGEPLSLDDASPEPARLLRAVIRVRTETLWIDRGEGLRPELCEVRAPVLSLSFEYEGFSVRAADPSARVLCAGPRGAVSRARDTQAERDARLLLESVGAIELELLEDHAAPPDCDADYAVLPEQDEQAQCAFVAHALPQLRAAGFGVELADEYPYRVVSDAPFYAELEPAEKPAWFDLELGVEIDGRRVNLLPVLLELIDDAGKGLDLARMERQGPRYVRLPEGDGYVEVPGERFRTLARVLAELYQGVGADVGFPAVRLPALAQLERALSRGPRPLRVKGVPSLPGMSQPDAETEGDDDASAATLPPPRGIQAELRPYQLTGVRWLQRLREAGRGGVLADDMGLGKTLQTIAHLSEEHGSGRASRPSLVIAPTSLTGNWCRELERFAPALRVARLYGEDRRRRRFDLFGADVAITSYPVLLRDEAFLSEHKYHCVVLDEAQAIKNPRSRASQLVRGLSCEQRIALSGTPIENHLHELWSLMDFAVPGLLGSEEQFRAFYRGPIEHDQDMLRLSALRSAVRPYVLRRIKEQVATELPPKTEIVTPVELSGAQRELYESIRVAVHEKVRAALRKVGLSGSTVTVLAALMKLRQLCCDPRLVQGEQARAVRESAKLERLMQMLPEQVAAGRRVLVFSQFATMLGLIGRSLHERGIEFVSLTGQTQRRDRVVRAFQAGDAPVFLISLKAGGTGLTLTRADTVIHYDPWWNPAAQDQATDRAHRIGQDKPVFVHKLIVAGSVEARMLALQQRKRRLADAVIGGAAQAGGTLGEAELEHLLAPLDE
jgi:superfamily II DNA or RNA helicase